MTRLFLLVVSVIGAAFSQNLPTSFTFTGSANDAIRGVAIDAQQNIYVAGTTSSGDLPLRNAYQPVNSGTQLIYSSDAGATWKPLSSPFNSLQQSVGSGLFPSPLQPLNIVPDPTNASTFYAFAGPILCKSTDSGQHVNCTAISFAATQPNITSLAIDPKQPNTIYLSASVIGGVLKSTDGGQTWSPAGSGLPTANAVGSVTIDPFHSNVLYAWAESGGYVSQDAAASWHPSSLPWPSTVTISGALHFTFDPVTPGVIYGPGYDIIPNENGITLQKSIDGGQTWQQLNAPFSVCCVVADPKTTGVLYMIAQPKNPPTLANGQLAPPVFWKSTDGGNTWTSSPVPTATNVTLPVLDPANPQIILEGGYRSTDGGQTWTQNNASRVIQAAFAPAGTNIVYATAPLTSDAFVAKFLPDGKTLVWATYFGGMGTESAGSIALDASGNIWIAGSTSSYDLPVRPGAYQSTLKGVQNGFVAKFSNDGKLLASSYVGGSNQDYLLGVRVNPQGNPWVIGTWSSKDFPFSAGPQSTPSNGMGVLAELDPSASQLLYAAPVDGFFDGNGKGIAIDSTGNVTVTGYTLDAHFAVTVSPFPNVASSTQNIRAFVVKVDASGKQIYSTMFGGSIGAPTNGGGNAEHDYGVAVTVDGAGNSFIAGNTNGTDFPVTAGSHQTTVAGGCPYPAFTDDTGLIGTISDYIVDDNFVVKLSTDGRTALYSTLIGGSCYDRPTDIAVNAAGDAYIVGETDSQDYPLVAPVAGAPATRQFASFLTSLDPAGSALRFSTYLYAGSAPSVAVAPNGSIYVGGDVGPGSQTMPDSGFVNPFPLVATDAYLAVLQIPQAVPPILLSGVVNAFSLNAGPIAAGEIVALDVPGFVPSQNADIGLNLLQPLGTNLAGVQVSFDSRAASTIAVYPGKIVCIAPAEIAGESFTQVQVSANGASSNVLNAGVAATALGLLSFDESGTGLANARNADGSLNSATNPASPGSFVTVYLTGAGLTQPSGLPVASITSPFGSAPALPLPGFVPGLFSYTFLVPSVAISQIQVVLKTDSSTSQPLNVYVQKSSN